jgi:putative copper resistance protein D
MFPLLSAFGGVLLLTHAHAEFELKSEYLIQSTHTMMGLLAMFVAAGRWLELRLAPVEGIATATATLSEDGKIAGFIGVLALFLIGLIMMFYREPLF